MLFTPIPGVSEGRSDFPLLKTGQSYPKRWTTSVGAFQMPKKDRAILDQVIRAAFKAETEVNIAGWTTLGLHEITRKRDRLPLRELLA